MAQTWHQLRPGEVRNDCGGCHAHSQKPTLFKHDRRREAGLRGLRPDATDAAADRPRRRTSRASKWDVKDETGPALREGRQERRVLPRRQADPRRGAASPATRRRAARSRPATSSSTTTTTSIQAEQRRQVPRHLLPPGDGRRGPSSGTSRSATDTLAASERVALRPHVPVAPQPADLEDLRPAARRLRNDDFPTETKPGDPQTLQFKGQPVPTRQKNRRPRRPRLHRQRHAAAGRGARPARSRRSPTRTGSRWSAGSTWAARSTWTTTRANPAKAGCGWMLDDQRPTLTLTLPGARQERRAVAHPGRHARLRHRARPGELPVRPTSRVDGVARPARTWRSGSSRCRRACGN